MAGLESKSAKGVGIAKSRQIDAVNGIGLVLFDSGAQSAFFQLGGMGNWSV